MAIQLGITSFFLALTRTRKGGRRSLAVASASVLLSLLAISTGELCIAAFQEANTELPRVIAFGVILIASAGCLALFIADADAIPAIVLLSFKSAVDRSRRSSRSVLERLVVVLLAILALKLLLISLFLLWASSAFRSTS
jgi:hypothetical protein